MTVAIRPATLRDACFVAANMREQDRREIGAVVSLDNPAAVAWTLLENSGDLAFCAFLNDQPVAVYGVARLFDHVGSAWSYGTDDLPKVIPAISRHGLCHTGREILRRGYRRLEIRTLADHDVSHSWLLSIGAECETPEPYEFGRNGELFKTYAWTRTKWEAGRKPLRSLA